jgi:polyphosphate glucokinase
LVESAAYRHRKMLFRGLGLGSTLIVDGIVGPMELGHLPYKKGTYKSYMGDQAFVKRGKKKWCHHVVDVVERLTAARESRRGSDWRRQREGTERAACKMPSGDNYNAFQGGFRFWRKLAARTL